MSSVRTSPPLRYPVGRRGEILGPKTAAAADRPSSTSSWRSASTTRRSKPSATAAQLRRNDRIQDRVAAEGGQPLRRRSTKVCFGRPERPAGRAFPVAGRLDGEIENGSVAFVGAAARTRTRELTDGAFQVRTGDDGKFQTALPPAPSLSTSRRDSSAFPGPEDRRRGALALHGPRSARRPDGSYSGIVDAELSGKAGVIDRAGPSSRQATSATHPWGHGRQRPPGDRRRGTRLRLPHGLPDSSCNIRPRGRRAAVPLVFHGPFEATLRLEDAGSGDEGVVTGEYQFKVPWPPIELAAFEVLKGQVEPGHLGHHAEGRLRDRAASLRPCGGGCFLVDLP